MLELTAPEQRSHDQDKEIIRHFVHGWMDAARALQRIHDTKTWRGEASTFEDFCVQEFAFSRAYAYRIMNSLEARQDVCLLEDYQPPDSEAVAKELSRVTTQQRRADAWVQATDTAPKTTDDLPRVSPRHMAKVVDALVPRATPEHRSDQRQDTTDDNQEPQDETPPPSIEVDLWVQFAQKHNEALAHLTLAITAINWIEKHGEEAEYMAAIITRIKTDYKALRGTITSNTPVGMSDGRIRTKFEERK